VSIAVYPGSFDPLTFGHLDVLERAVKIFDKVIIAVAKNPDKDPLFTLEERVQMIRAHAEGHSNVDIDFFDGLLINYAHRKKATVILRGLRAVSDFEFEFQMALTNRKLADDIETVFMMPSESYSYLSSRIIKAVAKLGGNVEDFVPKLVAKRLKGRVGLVK
jgi:pantetheine-phosphate adenylyltransferase